MKEDEMQTRGIFEVVIFAQCLQISRPVPWRGPGKGLGTASVWSQVLSAPNPQPIPDREIAAGTASGAKSTVLSQA